MILSLFFLQSGCSLEAKLSSLKPDSAASDDPPSPEEAPPTSPPQDASQLSFEKSTIELSQNLAALPVGAELTIKYCLKDQYGNPFDKSDLNFSFAAEGGSSALSFSTSTYNSTTKCYESTLTASTLSAVLEIIPQVNSAPVAAEQPKLIEVQAPRLAFTGNSLPTTPVANRIATELAPWQLTGNCDPILGPVYINGGINAVASTACASNGTFSININTDGVTSPYFSMALTGITLDPLVMIKQGNLSPQITRVYRLPSSTAPTYISTPAQLQAINVGKPLNRVYFLVDDIDLSAVSATNNFTAIGASVENFWQGILFGDGLTIRNLHISTSGNYKGIFGYANNSSVFDLHFENATISAGAWGGVLAGQWRGSIAKRVSVVNGSVSGGGNLGLIAGESWGGTIADSWASGSVTASSVNVGGLVGGLVGYGRGVSISDSWADVTVTGSNNKVGGLVGEFTQSFGEKIENTFALGNVSGAQAVGGLIGLVHNTEGGTFTWLDVINSFSAGSVSAVAVESLTYYSGGAIGSAGTVSSTNVYNASPGVTIQDVYYKSNITCTNCSVANAHASPDTLANMLTRVQGQWDFEWKWTVHSSGTRPDLIANPKPDLLN